VIDWLLGGAALGIAGVSYLWPKVTERGLDQWLPEYWATRHRRRDPSPDQDVHLILCIADHYEPKLGNASSAQAQARVDRWVEEYPRLFDQFRDSDGQPPRHTFFYPAEEYEARYLDQLSTLCRKGFGEVEVHLHHDNDTSENLRQTLLHFKQTLHQQHGLLSTRKETEEVGYAFIHGNWALDNSRPDGRLCGVNNELDILCGTGCFADMTFPSAPSPTQTSTINSIYYAVDDPQQPKSHDRGVAVGLGSRLSNSLLMVQGPLLLDWSRRRYGIPRIENACLQGNQAPSPTRLALWLRSCIQVPQRPDWYFVKLHTHGADEKNMPVLLGPSMQAFHQHLRDRAQANTRFHYHYVTAREMVNLIHAAESNWTGSIDGARDFFWKGILTSPSS
jgi:hypothetical protein